MSKRYRLIGMVFSRLTVIGNVYRSHKSWVCRCECGKETMCGGSELVSGRKKSCGCFRDEILDRFKTIGTTHGATNTPEHISWRAAKSRCYRKNASDFAFYGGRGITMCERWRESFENFFADMGPHPFKGATLDRIDPNGNYEPGNCRWSDRVVQSRNRRNSRMITAFGETMCVSAWAERTGLPQITIARRLARGATPEDALSSPKIPKRKLNDDQVSEIRRRISSGDSVSSIAAEMKLCRATIADAAKGTSYAHVATDTATPARCGRGWKRVSATR